VAAGYGRNGSEEAAVLFPIDGHDVAQLHDARMSDRDVAGKLAVPKRERPIPSSGGAGARGGAR
jgi:hypothetical protein